MPTSRSVLSPELIAAIESGACVVTRNQRSAHWFKLLYANHALSQGKKAWATPIIQSFTAFVDQLWRDISVNYQVDSRRVLSPEQSKLLWERVVAESQWAQTLLSPQAAASGSYRAWERMHAWRITRASLVAHADASDSSEARALVSWSDRFTELCEQRLWLPAALLPAQLRARSISSATVPRHIVTLAGEDLLPDHQLLLEHLVAEGFRTDHLKSETPSGALIVQCCESSDHELQSAAAWAKQLLLAGSRSIGIVVSDLDSRAAHVRRVFADVFAQQTRTVDLTAVGHGSDRAQQEASFAIASYRRLADFPIVRAALDALQLASGRASSGLAGSVLRSPFFTAALAEGSPRALADARLRGGVREHYDLKVLEHVATQSNCSVFAQALYKAQQLRLQSPTKALPSAMAEQFIELWRVFGWPGEQVLDTEEQQIAARLQSCLAEFGALDELLGSMSFATAVREFEQLTRETSFEPRSLPAPITIIDSSAVDGLQFDAMWVTDIDESHWPPPAKPDPFIPIALQVAAGMPQATAQLTREHARRRFVAMQSMAANVTFSWAHHDKDVEVLPSPWLRELGIPEDAHTSKVESPITYAAAIFLVKPQLETLLEKSAPALTNMHARGGTRIFELQSHCPFRAFGELRLDAKPLDQVVPSIDARERGTLIHAALADIWSALGGSEGLHARSDDELVSLVRTTLARHATQFLDGASLHRARMLQIEQELAAERIVALLNLDRQRSAFRVVGRPETQEEATIGALHFAMRLDRTDELLDETHRGERVIVDYKTGNNISTRSWVRSRPEQPQLPLYAVTHPQGLAAVAFATVGAKGVAYEGVARDVGVLPGIKAFNDKYLPAPYTQWSGLLAFWDQVISALANDFVSGDARVDPLPTACHHCRLNALCRVYEIDEGLTLQEEGEDVP